MARRPLERERISLDGGRRTTQLMRDSLGSMLMTQRGIIPFALPLLCPLLLRAQGAPPSALPQWALSTSAHIAGADATISGVSLGKQQAVVEKALGHPDSLVRGYSEVIDSTWTMYYKDAEATLTAQGLDSFDCWSTRCHLPSKIQVGSTLREVVRALGRGHPGYGTDISYSLIYPIDRCDCWLELRFDKNLRIVRMSLASENS